MNVGMIIVFLLLTNVVTLVLWLNARYWREYFYECLALWRNKYYHATGYQPIGGIQPLKPWSDPPKKPDYTNLNAPYYFNNSTIGKTHD